MVEPGRQAEDLSVGRQGPWGGERELDVVRLPLWAAERTQDVETDGDGSRCELLGVPDAGFDDVVSQGHDVFPAVEGHYTASVGHGIDLPQNLQRSPDVGRARCQVADHAERRQTGTAADQQAEVVARSGLDAPVEELRNRSKRHAVLRVGERREVQIELRQQRRGRDSEVGEHRRRRHDRTDANVAGRDGPAQQRPGIKLSWHKR